MKRAALILLIYLPGLMNVYAQDAKLTSGQSFSISPFYSDVPMTRADKIEIKIQLLKDTPADSTIHLELEPNDFPNNPSLKTTDFKITKWKKDSVIKLSVDLVTSNSSDTLREATVAHIVIKGTNDPFYTVRLKHGYDPNKPFWIEAGSNFDLIDGLKPNNLFAGVFLYKRDIRRFCCWTDNRLGVFGGVYESKSSTIEKISITPQKYISSSSFSHPSRDSMYVFRDTGVVSRKISVRNVALFFSPQLRLSNHSANENGMHFFISLWAEMQWQSLIRALDLSATARLDSETVAENLKDRYSPLAADREFNVFTHYLGIGLPIYVMCDDARLYINPIFGASNQINSQVIAADSITDASQIKRLWSGFYAVQFRLNYEKYGIAFSGEVRGLLPRGNQPFVTLVLSKKFDLSKLIEF